MAAIKAQAERMDFAPTFQLGHPAAFEFANRLAELAPYWEDALWSLKGGHHVIDLRNLGIVAGIELERRPGAPTARAAEAFHKCFDEGVLIRVTADTIALSPPLIVERNQIDRIFDTIDSVLKTVD